MEKKVQKSKSKKKFFYFKWLDRFFPKKSKNLPEEEIIAQPEGFSRELEKAKIKFNNFHLTSKLSVGEEIVRKDYSIKKTADNLYKLEGKNYQVVLITGNSLQDKDGKTTGVFQLTEAQVNRAIQGEHGGLDSFLDLWNPSLAAKFGKKQSNTWKKVLDWNKFWQEQLILRLRADTAALLLVVLDSDFERFYMNTATRKQKKILHDELFYLNQGKNSSDWSPHSKNKTLLEPDKAIHELNSVIEIIEEKKGK